MARCTTLQIALHFAGHDTLSTRAGDVASAARSSVSCQVAPARTCFWCATHPLGQGPAWTFLDLCLRPSQGQWIGNKYLCVAPKASITAKSYNGGLSRRLYGKVSDGAEIVVWLTMNNLRAVKDVKLNDKVFCTINYACSWTCFQQRLWVWYNIFARMLSIYFCRRSYAAFWAVLLNILRNNLKISAFWHDTSFVRGD